MQMQQDQQQQRQHGPRPNHPQNYNMMSLWTQPVVSLHTPSSLTVCLLPLI
jgi:hypothetical protein